MDITFPPISRSTQRQAAKAKLLYDAAIIGLLGALAAEIADLQQSLTQAKNGGDLQGTQARDQEINRVVASEFNTFTINTSNVETYLRRLVDILDKDTTQNQEYRELSTSWAHYGGAESVNGRCHLPRALSQTRPPIRWQKSIRRSISSTQFATRSQSSPSRRVWRNTWIQ
jgi:hypothetical protein